MAYFLQNKESDILQELIRELTENDIIKYVEDRPRHKLEVVEIFDGCLFNSSEYDVTNDEFIFAGNDDMDHTTFMRDCKSAVKEETGVDIKLKVKEPDEFIEDEELQEAYDNPHVSKPCPLRWFERELKRYRQC